VIYISCTIKELAKACGVSEGTVDRAVNNRSGIRESTKQHILEMAEQMDQWMEKYAEITAEYFQNAGNDELEPERKENVAEKYKNHRDCFG